MNRPIDMLDLFVWLVRIALVIALCVLMFGCITNSVSMATNPACVVSCKAEPARPTASSVYIEQRINTEKASHANP